MTLTAAIGLSAGAFNAWRAVAQLPWAADVSVIAMLAALVLGVLAVTALTVRELRLVDLGVLVLALYLLGVCSAFDLCLHTGFGTSEAALVPLIATATALGIAVVLTFVLLPVPWKSLGVLSCVGLPITFGFVETGLNPLVALLFLVVAMAGWTRTGELGVPGLPGVVRAVCLACAAAAEPFAWLVVPFVWTGIWLLRRGEPARWSGHVSGGPVRRHRCGGSWITATVEVFFGER